MTRVAETATDRDATATAPLTDPAIPLVRVGDTRLGDTRLGDAGPGDGSTQPAPAGARAGAGGRVAILDGLRLVAALMVVSYHYIARGDAWDAPGTHGFPAVVYDASRYGFFGVELFFLISGFVICMSGMGRSLGQFFVARVVRLYPAYWFGVLATASVVALWPVVDKPLSVGDTLTNLTMMQTPLHTDNVDGVYWTLWVELRFYLLFAVVVAMGVTYRRVVAFCALWTVASLVTAAVGGPLHDNGVAGSFLQLVFVPQYSPYFIAGMAFFLMHRFGADAMLWGIVGLQFLLAEHYLGVDPMIMHKFGGLPGWLAPVAVAGFFVLMALVALRRLAVGWRWLTVAGALTYPLYLLHQHIGWIVLTKFQHTMPPLVLVTIVVAGMLAAAWLVHRLVERPLAGRMRRVLLPTVARYKLTVRRRAMAGPARNGPAQNEPAPTR